MSKTISNLSLATEIKVEGCDTPLKIDFSDKRIINKLLHLQSYYASLEDRMTETIEEAKKIENPLERMVFISDNELSLLTELRDSVNDLFNTDVTGIMFGDCIPGVERYYGLFEALSPYIKEAVTKQREILNSVKEKYGLERLQELPEDAK